MDLQKVRPFYERHEFLGRFILDDITTDPVDVVIEWNKLDGGRIDGVIRNRGSAPEAAEVAQQVYEARKPWRLFSVPNQKPTIEVDEVFVTQLSRDRSSQAPDPIAELSCGAVSETWHRKADTQRGMSFRLRGGLGTLQPRETWTNSWTGDRTIDRTGSALDLGISWPGAIELRNEYVWEEPTNKNSGRYAHVPTLHLGCTVSEDELTDDTLIARAKALADDATLLMSFARRQWIAWYQYAFWTPRSVYRHRIESSRDTSGQNRPIWDSPVGLRAAEFLETCFPRFREQRDTGSDLRLPITYAIPNGGFRYVEERFASAFWALEKLIELFVKREYRDRILNRSDFRRLSRDIKRVCKEVQIPDGPWGGASAGRRMIQDKVPELNRPPIGQQLQWLCDLLEVTWRDLYPANYNSPTPRFIKTRNEIFHSNTSVDSDVVWRETHRVSLLFERLVLRALGWSDIENTTPQAAAPSIDREL